MSKLKLSDNRLFIAWGIIVVLYGVKIVMVDIDVEETRKFMTQSIIKDVAALLILWIGLSFILEREG